MAGVRRSVQEQPALGSRDLPRTSSPDRIAVDRHDVVSSVTGDQIVLQLMANHFGGVVSNAGPDFVDITIRGSAGDATDHEAHRGVVEVTGICG